MIKLYLLLKRLAILSIPCIIFPFPTMALPKWQSTIEDDPWKVSAFVSATMKLFLSILLFLGATIAFFTSCIVKFFGLEPPCTYFGCAHPLHVHSNGNRESYTAGLKDLAAMEIGVNGDNAHIGDGKEHQSSCRGSLPRKRWSRSKHLWRQGVVRVHSNNRLNKGYAEDHHESLQVSASSEQEGKCKATAMKNEDKHCSDILWQGRSKRPRRRDFVYSNGRLNEAYPALLSARSNPESNGGFNAEDRDVLNADKGECEQTNMKAEGFSVHEVHYSEPVKANMLEEDAIKAASLADISYREVNPALLSARSCPENAKSHHDIFQVSANLQQEREHGETKMRTEDFFDHNIPVTDPSVVFEGCTLAEDANTVHTLKDNQIHDAELSLECVKGTGSVVNICKTEHPSKDLLPCEDDQLIIQFGSIIARTCIKDGIADYTNVDSGSVGVRELMKVAGTGSSSLEETGRNASSTDAKISQFDSYVFGEGVAAQKRLGEHTSRNDIIMCTAESSISTPIQEGALNRSPWEDDEDKEEATREIEQEEGLDALKMALKAERSMLAALETELENERNAAAVATNEAMAMISRLQEEKSAMQMQVAQLHRMSEERAHYDEQVMAVLKEILVKRETENMALEKEVEFYRENILEGNACEQSGSLVLQPQSKPLLLNNQGMELCSPLGAARSRGASCIPQMGPNIESEEFDSVSAYQNSNKRARDFPASAMGIPSGDKNSTADGLCGPHDAYDRVKKMGKCSSFTDDEPLSAREGPWVLADNHQELPGKEVLKSAKPWTTQPDEGQHLAGKTRDTCSVMESCGDQSKCALRSEGGEEVDGGCGGFIHDVYEVHTASSRSPPRVEGKDPLEVFDGTSTTSKELQPRISRHMAEFPPRLLPTEKPLGDIPNTPSSMVNAADWDIDLCEHHDLRSLSLVSREERQAEWAEIKQLALRIKVLEEDRGFLRETVESFKYRDAERGLLKEISQHLRELQVLVNFAGVSGGALLEETSVTSPSRTHQVKKRRYCSGLRQAQTLLQHRKSV